MLDKGYQPLALDSAPNEYPSSQNKIGLTGEVAMVVCANYVAAEVNNNYGTEVNWGMFNYSAVADGADICAVTA